MSDILKLLRLFRPYRLWMAAGIALSLAATLANITLMAAAGWFITAMGLAGAVGATINYFTPAAIIRACAMIRTGGRYAERLVTHEATLRLISRLRVWFYNHLEPLYPAGLAHLKSGDVYSRLRGDIDTLERFYLSFWAPVWTGLLSVLVIIAFIALHNFMLAATIGGFLIAGGLVVPLYIFRRTRPYEGAMIDDNAAMRAMLASHLQGMGDLLVYDPQGQSGADLEALNDRLQSHQERLNRISAPTQSLIGLFANLSLLAVLAICIPLVDQKLMTEPNFVMLALLALASFEAVMPLPNALQSLGGVMRAATRIFAITDQPAPIQDPATPNPLPAPADDSDFTLQYTNICFSYDAGTQNQPARHVLHNVGFTLKRGEKIAIIGPSGAGKSTIVNLALRFYAPQSGEIILNGQSYDTLSGHDIRQYFAVLPQRPYLFTSTIAENLHLAAPQATQEQMIDACRKAGLHDFIIAQPAGYDTEVGEHGAQLSGGQIKRLGLARALLSPAPCLILDEPGEGLDYRMEHDILHRVMKAADEENRAVLMITHRAVGLDKMGKIYRMKDGVLEPAKS